MLRGILNLTLDYIRPIRDIQALTYDLFRKPGDVTSSGGWGTYLTAIKCDLKALGKGLVAGAIGGGLTFVVTSGAPVVVGVAATLFVASWAYCITSQHARVKIVENLGTQGIKKTFWGREVLPRSPIDMSRKQPAGIPTTTSDRAKTNDFMSGKQGSAGQGSGDQGILGQRIGGDGSGIPDPNRRFGS